MKKMREKHIYFEFVVYKSPKTERVFGLFVLYIPDFGLFSEKRLTFYRVCSII